jgi:hypothetical protein
MQSRFCLLLSLSLTVGSIVGCGSGYDGPIREYADVTGTVSYQGAPLKMGEISFQPATGPLVSGEIELDGTYTVKAEIGPNTVTVISRDPEREGPEDPAARSALPPPKRHVPEIYSGRESGLKFDVQPEANTANFDLK